MFCVFAASIMTQEWNESASPVFKLWGSSSDDVLTPSHSFPQQVVIYVVLGLLVLIVVVVSVAVGIWFRRRQQMLTGATGKVQVELDDLDLSQMMTHEVTASCFF